MRISLSTVLFLCLLTTSLSAQFSPRFDPSIVILPPPSFIVEDTLQLEFEEFNLEQIALREYLVALVDGKYSSSRTQTDNYLAMAEYEREYVGQLDGRLKIASYLQDLLTHEMYDKLPGLFIASIDPNRQNISFKEIADLHQTQFVVAFDTAKIRLEGDIRLVEIGVSVYDRISDSLVFSDVIVGDHHNRGFTFTCPKETITCCLINTCAKTIPIVLTQVYQRSPIILNRRNLAQLQRQTLHNLHDSASSSNFARNHLPATDTTINLDALHAEVVSPDSTKFIAFFVEPTSANGANDLRAKYGEHSIVEYYSRQDALTRETQYFYCFIVYGMKYNDEWYHVKRDVYIKSAGSLEEGKKQHFTYLFKLEYFKPESAVISEHFWDSNEFALITKDSRGFAGSVEEYIGLPKIVAFVKYKENEAATH